MHSEVVEQQPPGDQVQIGNVEDNISCVAFRSQGTHCQHSLASSVCVGRRSLEASLIIHLPP